jgi:hypothetical protein
MKACDKVSSFRGANTLFQGQQINGQTQKEGRTQEQITEEISKERPKTQNRGIRTDPRHNVRGSEHIVKRDCSDD